MNQNQKLDRLAKICKDCGCEVEKVGENSYIANCGDYCITYSVKRVSSLERWTIHAASFHRADKAKVLGMWVAIQERQNNPDRVLVDLIPACRVVYLLPSWLDDTFMSSNISEEVFRSRLLDYANSSLHFEQFFEVLRRFGYEVEKIGENSYLADNGTFLIPISFNYRAYGDDYDTKEWGICTTICHSDDKEDLIHNWKYDLIHKWKYEAEERPIGFTVAESGDFNEFSRGVGCRKECCSVNTLETLLTEISELCSPKRIQEIFESYGYTVTRDGVNSYVADNGEYFIPYSVRYNFHEHTERSDDWLASITAFNVDQKPMFSEFFEKFYFSNANDCARMGRCEDKIAKAFLGDHLTPAKLQAVLQSLRDTQK